LSWALKTNIWWNGPKAADNTGNLISKLAFDWHDIIRLKAYRGTDIDIRSYPRLQGAQMTSTMVEYLQGIQTAKEATVHCKNGSENPAIKNKHFTRANNAHTRCNMYSNALWRQYY
jgi:hypothetical protein